MRYLLLLYGDPEAEAALSPEERRAIVDAHLELGRELGERGVLVQAQALGERLATDGPFAETKEQLGSFYVVDCESDDEALSVAARLPASPGLRVEVLPIAGP